jgi:purine nucleoside permease
MRRRTLVGGSLAAGLLIALLGGGAPAGGADSAFRVDKLILTTFDGEQEPFLRHQRWDRTFPAVGGEVAPILCRTADHVCVTMTGTTKSKSGASTMALLRDPRLQLDRQSLFIVAGIAGIRSQVGTLGGAGLADWIVDVDLGSHFVDRRQAAPHGWLPFDAYDQAAYRLNAELVSQAYQATRQLTLDDDLTAEAERVYSDPPRSSRHPACNAATPPAPTGSGSAPTGPTRPTTSCGNGSPRSTRPTAATAAPASSKTRPSLGR